MLHQREFLTHSVLHSTLHLQNLDKVYLFLNNANTIMIMIYQHLKTAKFLLNRAKGANLSQNFVNQIHPQPGRL